MLVQGAGVAESAPNPDGRPSSTNGDFVGQGMGNIASGLFRGIPVGGSVSATALSIAAGARSRWAAIFAGVWMLLILVAFSGLVSRVVMPTLAAVLIFAAIGSLRVGELRAIWWTGPAARVALVATFVGTLLLPVAVAVGLGVVVSLLLQLNREALDLKVVELVTTEDGRVVERPAPVLLPSGEPVVLNIYGSLLYAGARTLQARLPDPGESHQPVVILRLRGRTSLGATFFAVVAGYSSRLADRGGRLYLSGVDPVMVQRYRRTRGRDTAGSVHVFDATEEIGESTRAAVSDAQTWLVQHGEGAR